jgi:hypothetical protein
MHAREEGVAPGGAALLGVIVHEDRTFVPNAVDFGWFSIASFLPICYP